MAQKKFSQKSNVIAKSNQSEFNDNEPMTSNEIDSISEKYNVLL